MEINTWVKIGVVATCLAVVPSYIGWFSSATRRNEPVADQKPSVAQSRAESQASNRGTPVSDTLALVLRYGAPVVAGLLLFTSVLIACWRPSLSRPSVGKDSRTNKDEALLGSAPDVWVDYSISGERPKLIFSNKKTGTTATIQSIGPLVSTADYKGKYDIGLPMNVFPALEKDRPIECEVLGVGKDSAALERILEDGGPLVLDFVVIDYDDGDGHQFSRVFTLSKNQNGTIVWTPGTISRRGEAKEPNAINQSIEDLRLKLSMAAKYPGLSDTAAEYGKNFQLAKAQLRTLSGAEYALTLAGQLRLLARQAESLRDELKGILVGNLRREPSMDLSQPLQEDLISLKSEGDPIPWQRRHLLSFRDRYNAHRNYITDESGYHTRVDPPNLPSSLTADQWDILLKDHATALRERAQELAKPHIDALTDLPF